MLIKAICNFFDRRPVQQIDKDVKFFLFSPENEVGVYFSDQTGLAFEPFTKQSPSRVIPPLPTRSQKAAQAAPASSGNAPLISFVRLVYFVFLDDGDILTVSFQTGYTGTNADRDWAIAKANPSSPRSTYHSAVGMSMPRGSPSASSCARCRGA